MNFEALFEEFLRERRLLRNIAKTTENYYKISFSAFRNYGGADEELSKTSLTKWVMRMREAGVKPKSCNTYITAINAFAHWLYENEVIPRRIDAQLIKLEKQAPIALLDETVNRLADFKPQSIGQLRTHTILSLLIDTGMRIDEALGCRLSDVDFEQSLVTIKGKGNKTRTIPISFEMRKRLWKWIKKRGDNPCAYLFPTRTYGRMEYHNYRRDLTVILKKLKITERIHPHAFRHYFAVSFLKRGGDLFRLSKILGHANINVTEIYLQSMGMDAITDAHRQFSPLMRN